VGGNALHGRFRVYSIADDVYGLAHRLSIHYFKLVKDLARFRQRLGSKLNEIFPELEGVIDPASKTGSYLLGRYTYPGDFAAMDLEAEYREVWKISGGNIERAKLEKLVNCARTSVGVNIPAYQADDRLVMDNMLFMIKTLEAESGKIMERLLALLSDNPYFKILCSIKGIGETTAALFVAEAGDLRRFKNTSELEKYAGSNLRLCESGVFKGRRRLAKHGNKRLLHLIYLICDQLRRYVPSVRQKFIRRRMHGEGNFTQDVMSLSSVCLRLIMSLTRRGACYEEREAEQEALQAVEAAYEEYRRKKAA
jgi:hypothetical protein